MGKYIDVNIVDGHLDMLKNNINNMENILFRFNIGKYEIGMY